MEALAETMFRETLESQIQAALSAFPS